MDGWMDDDWDILLQVETSAAKPTYSQNISPLHIYTGETIYFFWISPLIVLTVHTPHSNPCGRHYSIALSPTDGVMWVFAGAQVTNGLRTSLTGELDQCNTSGSANPPLTQIPRSNVHTHWSTVWQSYATNSGLYILPVGRRLPQGHRRRCRCALVYLSEGAGCVWVCGCECL